jgi:transposase
MHKGPLLNGQERHILRERLKIETDARKYRQILALLEVDRGRHVADVAQMLQVRRGSVYDWIEVRHDIVHPGRRSSTRDERGRPSVWSEDLERLMDAILEYHPNDIGYTATEWTVPLIQQHLKAYAEEAISDDTIRRYLRARGYRWNRPRYELEPDPQFAKKSG